jgi:chromosome segregation ATPase
MPPKGSKRGAKSGTKLRSDPQALREQETLEDYHSEEDYEATEEELNELTGEVERLWAQKQKLVEENEARRRDAEAKRARILEAQREIEAIQVDLRELEGEQAAPQPNAEPQPPNHQEQPNPQPEPVVQEQSQRQSYVTFDPQSPLCEQLQYTP